MKLLFFLSFFTLQSVCVFSQSLPDSNTLSTINNVILPDKTNNKGIRITSADSIFQLTFRFRMQNALEVSNRNNTTGINAQVKTLNLKLDGFIAFPELQYYIQLGFASNNRLPQTASYGNLNIVRDAFITYQPNHRWLIGFGQTKLPGDRQSINSDEALQLTSRSAISSSFGLDRDFGIHLYYLDNIEEKFYYRLKTTISTGEGKDRPASSDRGLAYTGRIELFPLGLMKDKGEYFEGDLSREETSKVYIAGTYHYNERSQRVFGQRGEDLFSMRDARAIFLDAMFKYRGFSFMADYMKRDVSNPITYSDDSLQTRAVMSGCGYDFQSSYLFKNNFEIIGRFSQFTSNKEVSSYFSQLEQYTLGVTKYIRKHKVKCQTEVTWNNYPLNNRDFYYFRFQVELGI